MNKDISITIQDVANDAGVSVATVSRVLNEIGNVSLTTSKRVRASIERLGYTPNLSAQNLRKKESKVVLIIVQNFTNPFYSGILSGLCEAAQTLGYSAFINSNGDTTQDKRLADFLYSKRVDGAILLSCSTNDCWLSKYADQFPIVQCAEAADNVCLPYVSIDNYSAMCDMISYIRGLGHEKIGYVNIDNKFLSTRQRKQGYIDSVSFKNKEQYIINTQNYDYESGMIAAEKLFKLSEKPTAIVCGSDMLALGVIAKARELGLSVPADVSVTGFDDVEYTKMFQPYLTTVAQPCYELGWSAMHELKASIDRGYNGNAHIVLPYQLKIRDSCAKIDAP